MTNTDIHLVWDPETEPTGVILPPGTLSYTVANLAENSEIRVNNTEKLAFEQYYPREYHGSPVVGKIYLKNLTSLVSPIVHIRLTVISREFL